MAITKASIINAIDEVIEALAQYEERTGRQVQLVIESDGTATLMGAYEMTPAGEPADAFEEVGYFETFESLWLHLQMAEADCATH